MDDIDKIIFCAVVLFLVCAVVYILRRFRDGP